MNLMTGQIDNDSDDANSKPPSLVFPPTSSPSPVISSRQTSFHTVTTGANHTTTIFMGEGTPRQEPLGSPHEDSAAASPPPVSMASQQIFIPPQPSATHPITSLELRVRWLEALVSGVNTIEGRYAKGGKGAKETSGNAYRVGLLKQANEVQRQLDQIVSENDQLRRFMGNCQSTALVSLKPTDASRLPQLMNMSISLTQPSLSPPRITHLASLPAKTLQNPS
jgi:hypothetical protein